MSNNAKFLMVVRILVDETTKDSPMPRQTILAKCKAGGFPITEQTFIRYVQEMKGAGIVVGQAYQKTEGGYSRLVCWYEDGWI